jgi:adenylate kinase family enzyme
MIGAVRPEAVLLLGPTGSGKTPLGRFWEREGLGGRPCRHFDFGERLRSAAAATGCLSPADRETVRRVLASGALLEDDQFPIALSILSAFIQEERPGARGLLILNGLPRHAGQARDAAPLVDVLAVARLKAGLEVLLARIRRDTGGDRAGRADDDPKGVADRLRLFEERTLPLEAHYRAQGIPVLALEVEADMTAGQAARRLEPGLLAVLAGLR